MLKISSSQSHKITMLQKRSYDIFVPFPILNMAKDKKCIVYDQSIA